MSIKVGDILYASYSWSSRHNYYLLVTRRTAKTIDMVRLEREIVTDDGYGQNGTDRPHLLPNGAPVISTLHNQTYKGKRIKVAADGTESVKVDDYISSATKWDGVSAYPFYTD